jgi:hypothetical protein
MKNLIVLILIFFFCGCTGKVTGNLESNKIQNVISKHDSIVLDKDTVILVSPSIRTIDSLKTKLGDDFYTVADDANYYCSNVIDYLDSINKKFKSISDSIKIFYRNKNNKLIKINPNPSYWSAILYKSSTKSYEIVAYVDFKDAYQQFFNENNNPNISPELNTWIGKYKFYYEIFRGREEHSFDMEISIDSSYNAKLHFEYDDSKSDTLVKGFIENNQFIVRYYKDDQKQEYILKKDSKGNYFISGSSIYLLNPPNDNLDIEKTE